MGAEEGEAGTRVVVVDEAVVGFANTPVAGDGVVDDAGVAVAVGAVGLLQGAVGAVAGVGGLLGRILLDVAGGTEADDRIVELVTLEDGDGIGRLLDVVRDVVVADVRHGEGDGDIAIGQVVGGTEVRQQVSGQGDHRPQQQDGTGLLHRLVRIVTHALLGWVVRRNVGRSGIKIAYM
ncbi:MAG: hypothetical protein RL150_272 [Candidatus Parcubacteria bacterium]